LEEGVPERVPLHLLSVFYFPQSSIEYRQSKQLLCRKSSSYCKSRAKAHPDERDFEKIRLKNEF
jgi:hypothetical protein